MTPTNVKWFVPMMIVVLLASPVAAWGLSCVLRGERVLLEVQSVMVDDAPASFVGAPFQLEADYEDPSVLFGQLYDPDGTQPISRQLRAR